VPGRGEPQRVEPQGAAQINILSGGGGPAVRDLYERSAYKKFREWFPGSTINMDDAGNPLSKVLTLHAAGSARLNPPNFDGVTRAINTTIGAAVKDGTMNAKDATAQIARDLEQLVKEASYTGTTRT
jgi:hypothetical protein